MIQLINGKIKKNQKALAKKINELESHIKAKVPGLRELSRDFEKDTEDYDEYIAWAWEDFENDDTSSFKFFGPILTVFAWSFLMGFIYFVLDSVFDFESAAQSKEALFVLSPYFILSFFLFCNS